MSNTYTTSLLAPGTLSTFSAMPSRLASVELTCGPKSLFLHPLLFLVNSIYYYSFYIKVLNYILYNSRI